MKSTSIDQQLDTAEMAIEGVLGNPEMQKLFNGFGYNREKILKGKALLDTTRKLNAEKNDLKGSQKDASAKVQEDYQQAWKTYMRHVTIARLDLPKTSGKWKKLQLSGERKRTYAGWLEQARLFYHELSTDATLLAQIDITPEDIAQAKAMIEVVKVARRDHKKSLGASKEATQTRDQALADLKVWMNHFFKIAAVALAGKTKMLETLGM